MRVVLLLLLSAALLVGATLKLYLKDGGYHLVREYQVQGDRIRYFSTERGDWEEVPVTLVDLAKTEREHKAQLDRTLSEARASDEEEQAERAHRREIEAIPLDPGAYYKTGDRVDTVPSSDFQVITDKKRRALQIVSPVPLIPGKAVVVIKGERAKFVVSDPRPSFYLRLAKEERFGIVRLTPRKNMRVVENISIVPVANQAIQKREHMETFEQQLADGLFRVWPEKPLTPGEYALIEFSEKDSVEEIELLVWDFAYQPAGN